ncbi:hypothetical protein [Deinococcus hopiensis]|uniref:Uncharacterized protein n=1 Tax=Deinococcus hopiensis KR-140 TaxID=695939 RepID=A0A1W1VLB2_9DEIO|nr:hypothetical protein [Deinococcus hopiensis]SMB94152.1 hypothetical protein SAMN00790413_02267 [Deinococcus hopiensis KR-140]
MDREKFYATADYLKTRLDDIRKHERAYKSRGVPKVRTHLQAFLDGTLQERVDVLGGGALDLLGWQLQDPLNELAAVAPTEFRAALEALWTSPLRAEQVDTFWVILDPALDRLKPRNSKAFNGLGARTTVASYLLYVADPTRFPFYMPTYGGKAIEHLYGKSKREKLDDGSPGVLMRAYTQRCTYLLKEFRDAGVGLEDMMDLHSGLHLLARDLLKAGNA